MLKTLLKSAFIIILLAGVFFVGLQYWEKQKRSKTPVLTEMVRTPEPVIFPVLSHVNVSPSGDGAVLEIGEISPAYRFNFSSDSKSLVIDVPSVRVSVATPSLTNPNPLIASVDVSTVPTGEAANASIKVNFVDEVNAHDRYVGKTLYVDITAKPHAPTQHATVKVSKKSTHHKEAAVHKAPKKVAKSSHAKRKAKREPEPFEDFAPAPREEFVPPPDVPAEPPPPAKAERAPPPPAKGSGDDKGNMLDLDKLFAESQAESVPPPPSTDTGSAGGGAPSEESPKVAMLPPKTSETFDTKKIAKEFPKILSLDVSSQGGATVIKIGREKSSVKYKVNMQRNPGRINIEFLNANNSLKSEYPAFAGTKISRITTQEFRGQEYLVRVTIYVEGAPEEQHTTKGNAVVVTIP